MRTAGAALLLGVAATAAGYYALRQLPGGVEQVRFHRVLTAGEVSYAVPNRFLQQQVATGFPQTYQMTNTIALTFANPRFRPDPDARFLQLELDFAVEAAETARGLPDRGTATLRGQVRFDRAAGTVALSAVELVGIEAPGNDLLANLLLPALFKNMVAPSVEGTVIYELPAGGGFWQETAVELVRDVRVEDGHVVIAVGP